MDGKFYALETFFVLLGCYLVSTRSIERGKAFILLFLLILANFFWYLANSELILEIAYVTPESPSNYAYYYINLYIHTLWLMLVFLVLQGISNLNNFGDFWILILWAYAWFMLIGVIAASYCIAWYAQLVLLSPGILMRFPVINNYITYIFYKDGNDVNDVGMVLGIMLCYLWPLVTFLHLFCHLIFNTWWALNCSIGLVICFFSLNYLANWIEKKSFIDN